MSDIFVDTSAWFAIIYDMDAHHAEAVRSFQRILLRQGTMVTSNYVVGETYTLFRSRLGYGPAQAFLRRVRTNPLIQRAQVLEAWEEAAEDLLAQYADQDFSYVDATSLSSCAVSGYSLCSPTITTSSRRASRRYSLHTNPVHLG